MMITENRIDHLIMVIRHWLNRASLGDKRAIMKASEALNLLEIALLTPPPSIDTQDKTSP